MTALHMILRPNVELAASPNLTSSVHIRGCGNGPTPDNGLSRLISIYYYPKLNEIGR